MAEKSHTKRWQRWAIGTIALLFIFTSAALTVAVIIQAVGGDNSSSSNNNSTSDASANCPLTPVAASTLAAPAVYKPSGDVSSINAFKTTDLTPGSGPAAKNGDCLVVKYQGNLASNGTVFDEDYTKPQALQFPLGSQNPQAQVISGWEVGMVGMKVGGTRRLVIPPQLGYGANGSPPAIPGNAALVFVVKLLKIK